VVQAWKDNGLPPNTPFFMTEGNMGGAETLYQLPKASIMGLRGLING